MLGFDASTDKVLFALLTMQRHSWEQGLLTHALIALGRLDLAELAAREALVRRLPDGRLGVMGDAAYVVDPATNGEGALLLARRSGEPLATAAVGQLLEWLRKPEHHGAGGVLLHRVGPRQVWVDSLYMAPPFLAAAGYEDEAFAQVELLQGRLWNPGARLYSHIWDEDRQRWEREAFWGCGNGWAATGLVRTLVNGTTWTAAQRERLVTLALEVIAGCLAYQRADGLFHDVLDDPTSFVEANLAQMLATAIFQLAHLGAATVELVQTAERLREVCHRQVDAQGLVQGVCGAPSFQSIGTSSEGQAFHLLMEASASQYYATRKLP